MSVNMATIRQIKLYYKILWQILFFFFFFTKIICPSVLFAVLPHKIRLKVVHFLVHFLFLVHFIMYQSKCGSRARMYIFIFWICAIILYMPRKRRKVSLTDKSTDIPYPKARRICCIRFSQKRKSWNYKVWNHRWKCHNAN